MDYLNKSSVLVLNKGYQCIGTLSPKKALVALNSQSNDYTITAKAIDVVYKKNEDGSLNLNELDYYQALDFEEWLMVEPRVGIDNVVRTSKLTIRCPSVIVTNYGKIPKKRFRPTKMYFYEKQDGRCGYSGKKIPFKRGNLEHKQAKSHGGKDTFENLMFVDAEINSKRGNKPLEELGLKPLFNHKEPLPMPVALTIKHLGHPDWFWFLAQ
jgi:hypothetical protein